MTYLPIAISGMMLVLALLTFVYARNKDSVELNVKLDQCLNNTNSILLKQERQEGRIQAVETKMAVFERDLETAFTQIDELKETNK